MRVSISTNYNSQDREGLPVEAFNLIVETDSSYESPTRLANIYLRLRKKLKQGIEREVK